jgi:hypothetical protein
MSLTVTPDPNDEIPFCTCCAGSPGVRGAVSENGTVLAAYFAEPAGVPKLPMLRIGLVFGRFTDEAGPGDRISLALAARRARGELTIERIAPYLATFPELAQLGAPMGAALAAARPEAERDFDLVHAILAGDDRLAAMRDDGHPPRRHFAASG